MRQNSSKQPLLLIDKDRARQKKSHYKIVAF